MIPSLYADFWKFKAVIFNTSAVFCSGFLRVRHFKNNELMVQRHRKQRGEKAETAVLLVFHLPRGLHRPAS